MRLMPHSNQQPLTAPRGGSEHAFHLTYAEWEAAVFDRAAYFAVFELRNKRKETDFIVFPWAVRFARMHQADGACIYAVCESGRFTMLDPEKLDEWLQRWRENNEVQRKASA